MDTEEKKSGFAAIIGRPNVGKSTLMNHLIGQKIAITSEKPQTTRNRIRTVYTDDRGQIVFMDTPGIHQAKNRLGEYMVKSAEGAFSGADVILWLIEPGTFLGESEKRIASLLRCQKAPVILVINKIDTIKDPRILDRCMSVYTHEMDFDAVVPVSALRKKNTDHLLECIFERLPYGPMYYDEDTVTDQPMRQIAAEIVREKALRILSDEIPHGIAVVTESMKQRQDGTWDIEATIICERESHKGIIIGKKGSMIGKIGTVARKEIETMTGNPANLRLFVKVRKEWRDSDMYLKNFGYDAKADI